MDLWRSAVIRSVFCQEKNQQTPTQVHMALPFPLPSCANLDMTTSEKSRGGSSFTAEMEDTTSVCSYSCGCVCTKKKPDTCIRALQPHGTCSPRNQIPSRFNMHSCTNGTTRKASKPLSLRWNPSCKDVNNGIFWFNIPVMIE